MTVCPELAVCMYCITSSHHGALLPLACDLHTKCARVLEIPRHTASVQEHSLGQSVTQSCPENEDSASTSQPKTPQHM
jgi:hypothetical protein